MTAIFKKLFKRTTAALLFSATLIAVFAGVVGGKTPSSPRSVATISASADSEANKVYQEKLFDDNYAFISGGSVLNTTNEDGTHKFNYMSYTLQLKNADYRNFGDEKDKSTYTFSLYRRTNDGNDYPISKFKIVRSNGVILMLKKSITDFDGFFEITPIQAQGINAAVVVPDAYEKATKEFLKDGWELQYAVASYKDRKITEDIVWNDEITNEMQYPHIRLCVKTPDGIDSMAVNYFVEFDYEIKDYVGKKTGWVWWWESEDDIRTKKGTLYTSIRSPKGILQNMKDQGALEEEFPDEDLRNQAEEILGYVVKRNITVSYLEQIGNTPFARRVEKSFEMYVSNGTKDLSTLTPNAVKSALNIDTFLVLGSFIKNFELHETRPNYYVAKYYKGVYLNAYTNGGQSVDPNSSSATQYFLDINLSYADYYGKLVNDGIISEEMCSVVYNQDILGKYPELEDYTTEELYGYFGYIVIPTTYSLMDVWGEVFSTKTSIGGVCVAFDWEEKITLSAYNKLTTDYGYHWILRTLSGIAGFITPSGYPVDHYIFYADNAASEDVWIGQNGAVDSEDNSPSMEKSLEEQTLQLMQSTMDYLNNSTVSQTITPWESRGFRVVFAIATVGAMVLGSVYVYVRFGRGGAGDVHVNIDGDGSSSKTKKSTSKKTTKKK